MATIRAILLSLALAFFAMSHTAAHASALGDAAAALQPGEWVQFNTNGFNANLLRQGDHHALQYQESMKWDPIERKIQFVGSGHLEPYIQITYDEASNSWSKKSLPGQFGDSHGYDHMAIDPVSRRFFFRQFNGNRLEILNLNSGQWTRSATLGADQWLVAGGLAWIPELDGVLFVDSVQISMYSPSNDSWSTVTENTNGLGEYHNFAEYSPVHKVTIYGGGNGSSAVYRLDADGSVRRMGDAPVGLGIHQSMVVADPVSGNFLVFTAGSFYEYDPMADTWSRQSVDIPYQDGTDPGVVGASAAPISTHGVIMIVKYDFDNSKVFLYRHESGVGQEPPTRPDPPEFN